MIIPLNLKFKIHRNEWRRYRPPGTGTSAAALVDLQVKAAYAATKALADELGVDIKQIELIRKDG